MLGELYSFAAERCGNLLLHCLIGLAALCGLAAIVHADSAGDGTDLYKAYPPGILPDDLDTEILRVRGEVREGYRRALEEWRGMTMPAPKGNPPVLAGTGYEAVSLLGQLLNFDETISVHGNQACVFCHMPYAGFSGPVPSINATMSAYPGSTHFRAVDRTPMRYGYASRYEVLQYNKAQGDFYGGNFWDGRATGLLLQTPNAEQATDPPVSAGEMGFPDVACIVWRLSEAEYRPLFEAVWGAGALAIDWPADVEEICTTPAGSARFGDDAEPVALGADDRLKVTNAFDHWGQSASFYQSARTSARSRRSSTPGSRATTRRPRTSRRVTRCSAARPTATRAISMVSRPFWMTGRQTRGRRQTSRRSSPTRPTSTSACRSIRACRSSTR